MNSLRIGIHLASGRSSIAVLDGDHRVLHTATIPSVVALRDGTLLAGDAAEALWLARPDAGRDDTVRQLGERRSVPLRDTYYRSDHLAGELLRALAGCLGNLRADALENATAVIAHPHPAGWHQRHGGLLVAAARWAGFPASTSTVPSSEAGAWAPTDAPPLLRAGLLVLVLELGNPTVVGLVETTVSGRCREIGHALVPGGAGPAGIGDACRRVIVETGHRIEELSDARAVGTGAGDIALVDAISRNLNGPLRRPTDLSAGVAVGAARWCPAEVRHGPTAARPGPRPPAPDPAELAIEHDGRTFGVALHAPFEQGIDPDDRRTVDGYGVVRCRDRFAAVTSTGGGLAGGLAPLVVAPLRPDTTAVGLRLYAASDPGARYVDSPGTVPVGLLEVDVAGTVGRPREERRIEVRFAVDGAMVTARARELSTGRELSRSFAALNPGGAVRPTSTDPVS